MKVKCIFYTGDKVGEWTMLSDSYVVNKHRVNLCKCSCGFETTVNTSRLNSGKSKKCGNCSSKETREKEMIKNSLVGKTFGEFVVLERLPKSYKKHTYYWLCKCSCGKESAVCHSSLVAGKTKSCGCKRLSGNQHKRWNGVGGLSLSRWSTIKRSAEDRNISFLISIEYAWQLFLDQEKLCKLTGLPLVIHFPGAESHKEITASLDRIDSSKGYIEGNVQWVHKRVNILKNNFPEDEFISLCRLVADKSRV